MRTYSNLWDAEWKKKDIDKRIETLRECLLELIEELREKHVIN